MPFLVLALAIAFALSPLASSGFNGYTPEQFPIVQDFWPIQPAGWAFSIWGLIYAWLIAGAGFGALKRRDDPAWQAMRAPLAISLLIGTFWIAVANVAPVWATVMIWAMWASAVVAWPRSPASDAWAARLPVGLYAGWLTAASGVATAVVLGGYGVLSAQVAAALFLALVLGIALAVQARHPRSPAYPAAVAWALFGIIIANLGVGNWPIVGLGAVGIALLSWRFRVAMRV